MLGALNKLSQLKVVKTILPGLYANGGGLYLQVTRAGVKSWLFRYMRSGKARGMGLGPLHTIGLADARAKPFDCRRLLLDEIDPLDAKAAKRAEQKIAEAKSQTFEECAKAFIDAHRAGWKNAKHVDQWTRHESARADLDNQGRDRRSRTWPH